jgi:hypothetical protein
MGETPNLKNMKAFPWVHQKGEINPKFLLPKSVFFTLTGKGYGKIL